MTAEPTGVSVLTTAQAELTTVQAELTTAATTDLNQTSDDAATAAGISPTDEPKKTFQLTFDGDCHDYEGSAATNFTMSLRRTLAAKLQVEPAEIVIGDITCGSVRVPVTVPSSSAEALTKLVGSGDLSVNGMTATGVAELPSAPATTTTLAAAPIGAQTTLATAPTDAQATVQAELTTAQAKLTTVQAELTTVPAELTTVQAELTTVPAELTTVPAELTTVPAELTTVQAELTTVPAELTTVQAEPTTVPAELTTVQAELTMVPAELTTATTTDLNQTSDDAATAAGVSPTDEPKKTFQLTFDGDCNDYEGSAATNFTMSLRRTLAAKLQVEPAEIVIGDITCGSVRVPVTVPSSSAEALTKLVESGDLSVNGMTATGVAKLPSAPATTTTLAAAPIGAQTTLATAPTDAQATVQAVLTTAQAKLTTVQAELTTVPAELTTVQAELTTVPAELTTVPAELTTVPAELTTVQAELTTVQAGLTTVPAELTTVQAELTMVPAELTTATTTDLNQTNDDAATAAGVSPTDEPKKTFQLTFDGDCNDYEGSAATNFTMSLRRTLAAKLQVEPAEIVIGDITCGSVRVPVTIPSRSADVLTKLVGSGDLSVNGMTATGVAELPSAPATTTTLAAAPIGAQTTLATTPTDAQATVQAVLTTAQAKLTTVPAELTTVQAELTTVATTDLNQTSDDAATTAGISPTDEPRKTFQLTFDGDCSKYVGNNGGFAMLLRRTLASKLDLHRSEVVIGNITCGSVRVAVTIPSSSAEALAKLVKSGDFKIDGMTATGVVEQPPGPVETTTVPTPIGAQTTLVTTGATSSSVVLTSEVKTTMTTELPTMTSEVPTTTATSEMSTMTTKATTMTPEVTTMTAEMQTTPSNMSTMTPEVSTMTSEAATMTSAALPTTAPGVASTSPDEASTSAGEVSMSSPPSPPTTEAPDSLTSNERLIVIVVCVVGGLIVLLAVLYACCHCSHKLRTASYSLEAPGPKADYVQLEKLGRAAPTYKDEAARSAGAAGAAATAPNGNTRPGQEPDARRDSNDLNLAAAAVAPPSGGYTNPSYESRPDDSPVSQASTAEYQPGVQPYPGGAGARSDPQAGGGKVSGGFSPF